jgi:hypothetical protein
MSVKKPETVYGGPYAQESDAITAESLKKKPDYERLISGWKTVSQGALDFIASQPHKEPEAPEGPFVENVKIDYDKEDTYIPETKEFDRDSKTLEEGEGTLVKDTDADNENGAGGDEIPTPKEVAESDAVKGQTEVNLDEL